MQLPKLTLGHAIWGMIIIGLFGVVYVMGSAAVTTQREPFKDYAVGAMRDFTSVSEPPAQPLKPLRLANGETTTLASKRGKILLVNFWATWCAPCIVEMPYLNELQARYGSDDFEVVTISMDRTQEAAETFLIENNLTHLPLHFDTTFSIAFDVTRRGLPTTILYDRNGEELGRLEGEADWASEEAFALIEAAIERY